MFSIGPLSSHETEILKRLDQPGMAESGGRPLGSLDGMNVLGKTSKTSTRVRKSSGKLGQSATATH